MKPIIGKWYKLKPELLLKFETERHIPYGHGYTSFNDNMVKHIQEPIQFVAEYERGTEEDKDLKGIFNCPEFRKPWVYHFRDLVPYDTLTKDETFLNQLLEEA